MREGSPNPQAETETVTMARRVGPKPPIAALVRVIGAAGNPATLRLTSRCFVGSGEDCNLVIGEPTVSRVHAELELVPEGVAVRDVGSRNGTFYLDQRVDRIVLAFGGRVRLGAVADLSIECDAATLNDSLVYTADAYRGVVGRSPAMHRIFALLTRLEGSLANVLLEGESGTGKEVIAEALHWGSHVADGPFVVVNCGAIPRELVASDLFGHERGAFTGAVGGRKGAFESADGGTIFLDEIGELPLELQPALLRVLEKGEIRAVGSDRARTVKVRVVAATNRDLEQEVSLGRFREDLFYRLAVVRIRVPPLRQRPEDVEALARRFAHDAGLEALGDDLVHQLATRAWPGNVRELRNAVHAYAALGIVPEPTRSKVAALDLVLRDLVDLGVTYAAQKDELTDRFTRFYLEALLERAGGNRTTAARIAGLDRTHIGRLMAKFGMGNK